MEGVLVSLVHVFGYAFVLTGTTGIFISSFQFAFRSMFMLDLFRTFLHVFFIPVGSVLISKQLKTNFDYTSVVGLTRLFLSCTCLAVGTCGSFHNWFH